MTLQEIYQTIYKLAKEQNATELQQYAKYINIYNGTYTLIGWLAKEGDQQSVDFLLNCSDIDSLGRADAVKGAAHGNHEEFTFRLIEGRGQWYFDRAVSGAALGGHEKLLDQLLALDIRKNNYAIDNAVEYAAEGKHINLINKLISKGASPDKAVYGIWGSNVLNDVKTAADFIARMDDATLRKKITEQTFVPYDKESKMILTLAADYRLNYQQALAWKMLELKIWFMQGIKLVKNETLPFNLFIEISSHIARLSYLETLDIFNKLYVLLPKKMLEASISSASKKFFNSSSCFFTDSTNPLIKLNEYVQEIEQAKERYQHRVSVASPTAH